MEYIKNKKGAIGIGTLIVFIAMVLVAAVAASVLISTSGFLQQKAAATGRQSTEEVASGLHCSEVIGHVYRFNGKLYDMDRLVMYVIPNAGSTPIDLKESKLFLTYRDKTVVLKYNSTVNVTDKAIDIFNLENKGEINFSGETYPETTISTTEGGTNGSDIIKITTTNHKLMALLKLLDGKKVVVESNSSRIISGNCGTLHVVDYDGKTMTVEIINVTGDDLVDESAQEIKKADWVHLYSETATWGGADDKHFLVVPIQDYDGSVVKSAVINKGDIVAILINAEAAFDSDIPERSKIIGKLRAEFGAPAIMDITTPSAYVYEIIELQ